MSAPARPIKVVQAINSLALAGAEHTTTELSIALDPTQFEVHVVVVRDGPLRERLEQSGIAVHVVGGEFDLRAGVTISRTARLLRELEPDIMHTHMIGSDITGFVAARLAHVPIVLTTQHDTYHRAGAYDLFRRYSGPRLDATVAIGSSVVEYCRDSLHVPVGRIHVIENAVDTGRFEVAICEQRRPATFGAIGTLIPIKGHEVLIEAFARIATSVPGSRLLFAGQGPLRESLERRARDLGVADRVEFRGAVDVPAFLGEIDIVVHPSTQEAFGLALIESMASRKPVIASDLPAIRHILRDGAAGVLVQPGDVAGFAEAIERLANDPASARVLAHAGYEHVHQSYCRRRMAKEYAALYHLLLTGRTMER